MNGEKKFISKKAQVRHENEIGMVRETLGTCTGKNDSMPVSQTERIADSTLDTTASIFDRCGLILV